VIALRRHLVTIFGIGISVGAVVWLCSHFDLGEVVATLRNADPVILALTPVLIIASFLLRAQRWRTLVEHDPPVSFWPSFRALMIGYLLNNLLPARAGDVARVLELGRSESISRAKVLATLVTERVIDLATTLLILSLVLLSYPALPAWLKQAGIAVSAVTVAACAFLVVAHFAGQRLVPWIMAVSRRWLSDALGNRLEGIAFSALAGLAGMFRPRRAAAFLGLTCLIWAVEISVVYLISNASGLGLAPGNALFVLLVIALGSMVPSSPGFVGTYEFFGVSALGVLGHFGPQALAFIVLLHVVTAFGSTAIGAVCFLARKKSQQTQATEAS